MAQSKNAIICKDDSILFDLGYNYKIYNKVRWCKLWITRQCLRKN